MKLCQIYFYQIIKMALIFYFSYWFSSCLSVLVLLPRFFRKRLCCFWQLTLACRRSWDRMYFIKNVHVSKLLVAFKVISNSFLTTKYFLLFYYWCSRELSFITESSIHFAQLITEMLKIIFRFTYNKKVSEAYKLNKKVSERSKSDSLTSW